MKQEETSTQKPRFGSVILSILAAAIGVQSDKNRERDFANGSPLTFIIGGFVFTFLFIATVALAVGLVLSRANA